jgi:predicted helicase
LQVNTDPGFGKALKAFTRHLPEAAALLSQTVADAHAQCAAFNVESAACLEAFLAHFREENARKDPFGALPPHIQTWVPELDAAQLDAFLVKHLLLERLFLCAFPAALRHNQMSGEVARALFALEGGGFDRAAFQASLDPYYLAVEQAFRACSSRMERQQLLSTFCEQFINAYDREQAEEFSVIYTPQEIVQYMCERVEQELIRQFGASLSSPGIPVLDPCTGIGTYLTYVLARIGREMLSYKYRHELFGIEIMFLPYFIARLNIEQTFVDLTGWYFPFPGLRYASALS